MKIDDVLLDEETGRISHDGSVNFEFESFLDCLPPSTIGRLKNDCEVAFNVGGQQSSASQPLSSSEYHNKGSTWWIAADKSPRCPLEELAKKIFVLHTKNAVYDPNNSGAEWWVQVVNSLDDIGFHFDKDYGFEENNGICLYPHLGTVTYLTHSGGPTFVLRKNGRMLSGDDNSGVVKEIVVSKVVCGKHIKFDGRFLHAAPSQTIYGAVPAENNPKRITFLVNIWLNKRPVQSIPFPEKCLADFHESTDVSGCFQPSITSDGKKLKKGASGTFTKAPVPTVLLSDHLKVKGASLDLHRWSFVDGGVSYSTAIPLPTADKMKALSAKSDAFTLVYSGSGVEASINTNQCDVDDDVSDGRNDNPRKRKQYFWRPAHLLRRYTS